MNTHSHRKNLIENCSIFTCFSRLAEEATNKDPCSPDAKTMTIIAEASFEVDDYWRIVDVLHNR